MSSPAPPFTSPPPARSSSPPRPLIRFDPPPAFTTSSASAPVIVSSPAPDAMRMASMAKPLPLSESSSVRTRRLSGARLRTTDRSAVMNEARSSAVSKPESPSNLKSPEGAEPARFSVRRSSPAPPSSVEFPPAPERVSAPAPPKTLSVPSPPERRSARRVPTIVSLKPVPRTLTRSTDVTVFRPFPSLIV